MICTAERSPLAANSVKRQNRTINQYNCLQKSILTQTTEHGGDRNRSGRIWKFRPIIGVSCTHNNFRFMWLRSFAVTYSFAGQRYSMNCVLIYVRGFFRCRNNFSIHHAVYGILTEEENCKNEIVHAHFIMNSYYTYIYIRFIDTCPPTTMLIRLTTLWIDETIDWWPAKRIAQMTHSPEPTMNATKNCRYCAGVRCALSLGLDAKYLSDGLDT